MPNNNPIEDFIERAADELVKRIIERAAAKADQLAPETHIVPGTHVGPAVENVTVTNCTIEPTPTKKVGKPVNPDSKRQKAFAYFATGKTRKQVASFLKMGKWTVNQYAREWNEMAPGRKA